MARFKVTINQEDIPVRCNQCGSRDMFQHQPTLLTCNHCGNTFNTEAPATVEVEQVVKVDVN